MKTKQLLVGAAMAGFMMAGCTSNKNAPNDAPEAGKTVMGQCHGVTSCKGTGDCGGDGHSCAGLNSCKGHGWKKMSKSDCETKGGEFKS